MKFNPEKAYSRPLHFLLTILAVLVIVLAGLFLDARARLGRNDQQAYLRDIVTSALGLTDLCVSTEARYTRHPAVSDPIAPFMDHPGAFEHFPTGSFWVPPSLAGKKDIR